MHVFEDCWSKADKAIWDAFYWLFEKEGVISKADIVYYGHFAYSLGLMLRYFKVANKQWWTTNDEGTLILIES